MLLFVLMFVCTHCSSKCYVCACLFLKKRFLQKLEHMHSLPHIPIKGNLWINLLCLCRAGVGNKNYHFKKKALYCNRLLQLDL